MNDNEIIYDEWRQDVYRPDGTLMQANVLFIRARKGNIEFHCPIWAEEECIEWVNSKQDARDLLRCKIENFESND